MDLGNSTIIALSAVSVSISTWSIWDTYRRYEWLRWKVTRLGILDARDYVDRFRSTGITCASRNVFSGSYKRRYARAFYRTLFGKEVY